jgi:hypothetical protein
MCRIKIIPVKGDGSCFFHCIEIALGIFDLRNKLIRECLKSEKNRKYYNILRSGGAVDNDIFEFVSETLNINILVLIEDKEKHYSLYPYSLYYSKNYIAGMSRRMTVILKFYLYGHFDLVTLAHKKKSSELLFPFRHWFISKLIKESKMQENIQHP